MLKTKLLPLILILLLTFTLIGDCDWLAGWDYRIELEIADYAGDIGGEVVWFPVTVFLTSTQGQEVFTELTTDAEYLKVAFTKADGETELYAECELFDVSEQKAIFHISRDGWVINANTSIFLYYDKDHADNDTYIGAINTAAGAAVWDGNFLAVYHMVDATTSTIVDSTSNSYDLTKGAANTPNEITGKIGKAQDFNDNFNDYVKNVTLFDTMPAALTIEQIVSVDVKTGSNQMTLHKSNVFGQDRMFVLHKEDNTISFDYEEHDSGYLSLTFDDSWVLDTHHHLAITWDTSNGIIFYFNGATSGGDGTATTLPDSGTHADFEIARHPNSAGYEFDGAMDENRYSGSLRSAAWIKGTHNSLWDSLLTYGSEETEAVVTNIMFMFSDF